MEAYAMGQILALALEAWAAARLARAARQHDGRAMLFYALVATLTIGMQVVAASMVGGP